MKDKKSKIIIYFTGIAILVITIFMIGNNLDKTFMKGKSAAQSENAWTIPLTIRDVNDKITLDLDDILYDDKGNDITKSANEASKDLQARQYSLEVGEYKVVLVNNKSKEEVTLRIVEE